VTKSRPINLNLFTIRFPMPAIVSICHRMSGVLLFLLIPLLLALFAYSLTEDGFLTIQVYLAQGWVRFLLWLCLIPFSFHLVAGIRHLLMDCHLGSSLSGGRLGAKLTFVIFFLTIILLGIWLW
jgi:succinate dehydrogenase / fumarate reductase, cytochrome b subunit